MHTERTDEVGPIVPQLWALHANELLEVKAPADSEPFIEFQGQQVDVCWLQGRVIERCVRGSDETAVLQFVLDDGTGLIEVNGIFNNSQLGGEEPTGAEQRLVQGDYAAVLARPQPFMEEDEGDGGEGDRGVFAVIFELVSCSRDLTEDPDAEAKWDLQVMSFLLSRGLLKRQNGASNGDHTVSAVVGRDTSAGTNGLEPCSSAAAVPEASRDCSGRTEGERVKGGDVGARVNRRTSVESVESIESSEGGGGGLGDRLAAGEESSGRRVRDSCSVEVLEEPLSAFAQEWRKEREKEEAEEQEEGSPDSAASFEMKLKASARLYSEKQQRTKPAKR
uniref:OB domain-containing protein n=1 Tax=Chromera velia CCMP2878 TaxID=1169474 RepID=A0A0G4FVG8_9ALVE|eukprot:Cvel_18995.t1-p1 / transcript=Cvel_18995.t1 / gene=Cvel_18995 / organism=Chromera_velia_CCMP2878 / gene_product=hypothetical protein / transcript_product=hypothetical protein / location=Cvel_scaffold1607:36555-39087(-) / protein_length=334 / sequence_SO=supercontig / SO=protein_coding / is_pseudo=false